MLAAPSSPDAPSDRAENRSVAVKMVYWGGSLALAGGAVSATAAVVFASSTVVVLGLVPALIGAVDLGRGLHWLSRYRPS